MCPSTCLKESVTLVPGDMFGTPERMRSRGVVVAEVSQKEPMETHPALSPQKVAKIVQLVEKSSKWLCRTEKQEVIDLLAKCATVIPEREGDVGRTTVLQHSVYTGGVSPIQQQFRPFHQRTQCKELLQDMLGSRWFSTLDLLGLFWT